MSYLLALLVGIVAGLRTFTAPTAIAWAAFLGWLPLQGTFFAFMGSGITVAILTFMALGEFVGDKLPMTPSRKVPMQFGARLISGAFSGAALGAAAGLLPGGLLAGTVGAVVGTLGGAALRARLAKAFGRDLPAALLEDVVAIAAAAAIMLAAR